MVEAYQIRPPSLANNTQKVEDSALPLDAIRHHGFYRVGDKIFQFKKNAFRYASQTRQTVRWDFNNDVFGAIDWQKRSGQDLRALYRERAQQLRDKYSYLVLHWSGGADSHNAFLSFALNDIPLDEIHVSWPVTASQGLYRMDPSDTSASNWLCEWDFSLKPMLNMIRQRWPEIKITISDVFTDSTYNEDSRKTTFETIDTHFGVVMANVRSRSFHKISADRTEKYRSVCQIHGIGKLYLERFDDWIMLTYYDVGATQRTITLKDRDDLVSTVEFFYWTPDLTEIIREQCHVVMDHFRTRPQDANILRHWMWSNGQFLLKQSGDQEQQRHLFKALLYPDYPIHTWQAIKPSNTYSSDDLSQWLYNHPHAQRVVDQHQSLLRDWHTEIDPKFFTVVDGQRTGLLMINSGIYPIAKVPMSADAVISRRIVR